MPCTSSCSAALTISPTERFVAEVDDLGAGGLQDAAHDVDRRIVAVEQRRGGDEAHLVLGLVGRQFLATDRSVMLPTSC